MESGKEHSALPISVCILVLNEEDRLLRTLPPLQAFEDIVVLDSGSRDQSISMCENAGATVYKEKWEGFGPTRIKLFKKATQPWILWLDADEVVTPDLIDELQSLFKTGPEADGYEINRMVYFEKHWIRHGDWFPDWNLRLFRAGAWEMEPRAVHESLILKGRSERLNGLIEHHTYRNWEDQRKRSKRYARLWAEEHAKHKQAGLTDAFTHACLRFIKGFLFKRGFMDGVMGWKIAIANAHEVYLKYRYLRELNTQ